MVNEQDLQIVDCIWNIGEAFFLKKNPTSLQTTICCVVKLVTINLNQI